MPYLVQQPDPPLSPQPTLKFILNRLRLCGVEPELFSDAIVLDYLSEAYKRACERAQALQAVQTIALAAGTQEYAMPSDFLKTLLVYREGMQLERVPERLALRDDAFGYYEIGSTIGLAPTPNSTGNLYVLYVRSPAELATYDDTLDAAFVPEVWDLLVHYVRWKRYMVAGGAQRMSQAKWERIQYEVGVRRLRHAAARVNSTGGDRFRHPLGLPAPPRRFSLARDVDAR